MPSPTALSRSAGVSGRVLATLAAVAVALVAAFVVAPPTLGVSTASGGFDDQRHLTGALRTAFVEYWRSGDRELTPGLRQVVDYWFRYHVAKAVIAAILLVVLVALGVQLGRAFLRAGGLGAGRRAALASAGVLVALLASFSLAMVMANVQGAVAPFASLLPMLTDGAADPELTDALAQVRQGLADSAGADGRTPPALAVMISDFTRYHVAMVVIAAVVAAVLIVTSAVVWRRFASPGSDRRARRVLGSLGVLSVSLSLLAIVVVVANTATAGDPVPALLAFFDGGW